MYDKVFCHIYDELGWNYYPESFAELLLKWMQDHHVSVRTHLDYGCGTGVLCNILQQHGIRSTGIDLSPSMIELARLKYPLLHFEVGDMTSYQPAHPVSLITSTCDTINHLPSISLVEKTIQNAYRALADDGYFIFDLLKDEENQSCPLIELGTFQGHTVAYEVIRQPPNIILLITKIFSGDLSGIFSDGYDQKQLLIDGIQNNELPIELPIDAPLHKKFSIERKIVHEYLYSSQEILEILESTGFKKISLNDTFTSQKNDHGTTWYFIAQK